MQSDKLIAVTISGPIEQLDDAIRRYVVDKMFHPEDATVVLSDIRRLKHVEEPDPYTPCLAQADALLARMGLAPERIDFGEYDIAQTERYIRDLGKELTLLTKKNSGVDSEMDEEDDLILELMRGVPISVKDLFDLWYVRKRLGLVPEGNWPELKSMAEDSPDEFVVEIGRQKGYVAVLALALPPQIDALDVNLSRLGFERLRPEAGREYPDCTAEEYFLRVKAEQERAAAEEIARKERLDELIRTEGDELLRRRAWLAYQTACVRAKSFVGQNYGRFYLVGWTTEDVAESLRVSCGESLLTCVTSEPQEVKKSTKPPVRIKERGAGKVLSPLMKMYGIPAYGTADPRVFMVITYTLFFGMMFGDAGQGAVLALLGFLLFRKTGAWLWRVLCLCGCSAVIFGLIYGSVFGLEELLPWGGYHPLESDHIMPVLLAGAAVGVCVILVCMAFNIVNSLRMRDLKGAFFSPNGLCGAILYVAVIAGIVFAYTGWANLFTAPYILLLIVLPIVLIWLGEPLGKLLAGDRNWQPESWGMYIVEGFFDIFEAAISYMSNTMSFLRIGAFAISHAGMMMVVSMLAEGSKATGSVLIMVLGNIFVAALEAALSSIQIIRLEFYEIFGRFYVVGGNEFTPVTVQYSK